MTDLDLRRELDIRLLGEAMISNQGAHTLATLCDRFANRLAGSKGEWRTADYLLRQMRQCNLTEVHPEPFSFLAWERGRRPRLRVLAPRRLSIPAITLPYSPPTPEEGLELELVSLGEGLPEDFARRGEEVAGRAVMVTSESPGYYHRWVHRAEKYARAVAAGARAFLFINHYDGLLEPTGSARFNREAEIPALGLAKEAGQTLLRLFQGDQAVRVHLTTYDRTRSARGRNVVGELPGTGRSGEMIVVGGHYDGHDISQGAADNGAGVATVLETARLLAPHWSALHRTVRFVCFGAEEVGLIGSHAYVARHGDEMPQVRLMVNVDGIGRSRGKGFDFQGWDEAKGPLGEMAEAMAQDVGFASRPMPYSDHFPFMAAGVPVCTLGDVGDAPSGRGYGHTAADTCDKVARADLREAAGLLARSLVRFANDPQWKLRHKSKAQVRKMLDRYDLIDVMKTEGTLPKALR
ncbi:MAG: M20/M25/M40 family metallo-hydrolase [Candidatus Brocadiia bacterium]